MSFLRIFLIRLSMDLTRDDATPKYNPTICEELGIQPLDGYEAIEG